MNVDRYYDSLYESAYEEEKLPRSYLDHEREKWEEDKEKLEEVIQERDNKIEELNRHIQFFIECFKENNPLKAYDYATKEGIIWHEE